jgi:hypothetical protein
MSEINPIAPYTTINAYSKRASKEQIIAMIIFLVIIIFHSVFYVYPITIIDHPILWIILAITYALLGIMVYDYFIVTCSDPSDDLVMNIPKEYKP